MSHEKNTPCNDCFDKRCELCEAKHIPPKSIRENQDNTPNVDLTDKWAQGPAFPNGFHSTGGILHTINPKTGHEELHYACPSGEA